MTSNLEGLRKTEALCNKLKIDQPRQEIIKSAFKFIHKIIEKKKPRHIIDKLKIPKRITGRVYLKGGTKSVRANRSPINASVELYNTIPPNFRVLPHSKMKKRLKTVDIKYSLFK